MKEPSVTILVTVKNSKNTIEKCIDSLLRIDYKNYRIFVTDALSTDGTWEILEKMKEKNPSKIIIEQVRGNIARGHNHMIKKARTEFVALTDADCVVNRTWLKALMSSFTSKDVIAATGYCSTPKSAEGLQRLIGMELENRFKRAPAQVYRGPTMNLAIRTAVAKKVRFDERFDVAQETDWGYRVTKLGKMVYNPKAVVYHYHRSSLIEFLKQHGFKYGRAAPLLYWRHIRRATGDHITRPIILFQQYTFLFLCLSYLLSLAFFGFVFALFYPLPAAVLAVLICLYLADILSFTNEPSDVIALLVLYFLRNSAYTLGMVVGIFDLIFKKRLKS